MLLRRFGWVLCSCYSKAQVPIRPPGFQLLGERAPFNPMAFCWVPAVHNESYGRQFRIRVNDPIKNPSTGSCSYAKDQNLTPEVLPAGLFHAHVYCALFQFLQYITHSPVPFARSAPFPLLLAASRLSYFILQVTSSNRTSLRAHPPLLCALNSSPSGAHPTLRSSWELVLYGLPFLGRGYGWYLSLRHPCVSWSLLRNSASSCVNPGQAE